MVPLLLALLPVGVFALLVKRRVRSWWLLLPLAATAWALVHASGVHATVAGVLLGFTVPVRQRRWLPGLRPGAGRALRTPDPPDLGAVAVPVFAFFAAGCVARRQIDVSRSSSPGPSRSASLSGCFVGKPARCAGRAPGSSQRFTGARLGVELGVVDVVGIRAVVRHGFTVSLLIGELAFGVGHRRRRPGQDRRSRWDRCWPRCRRGRSEDPQRALPAAVRRRGTRRRSRRHARRLPGHFEEVRDSLQSRPAAAPRNEPEDRVRRRAPWPAGASAAMRAMCG